MFKFFTAALCFITLTLSFAGSSSAFADETTDVLGFNTKDIVRMKLWYEGMERVDLQASVNTHSTAKDPILLNEELSRALDKADF